MNAENGLVPERDPAVEQTQQPKGDAGAGDAGLVSVTGAKGSATFSKDMIYRYDLTRPYSMFPGTVCWVMLNPSVADADEDDATIRRCVRFSKKFGLGRMTAVNLFAYRSTDPRKLSAVADPVGPENERFVRGAVKESQLVIAAWGAISKKLEKRADPILSLLRSSGIDIRCLGRNKAGSPRHPVRVSNKSELVKWTWVA